jgi:hypothetical protein
LTLLFTLYQHLLQVRDLTFAFNKLERKIRTKKFVELGFFFIASNFKSVVPNLQIRAKLFERLYFGLSNM